MTWGTVIATRGRVPETLDLVRRLSESAYHPVQVIVVFQGESSAFNDLCSAVSKDQADAPPMKVVLHRDTGFGLSRARNIGLSLIDDSVDWAWTPNDNSRPTESLLRRLSQLLDSVPGEVGAIGFGYATASGPRRALSQNTNVAGWQLWSILEAATVWRISAVQGTGGFDERIGTGSATIVQSGEGTDLLCRMQRQGWAVMTDPTFVHGAGHRPEMGSMRQRIVKNFFYGIGFGYVTRQYFPIWRGMAAVAGSIVSFVVGRAVEGERMTWLEAVGTSSGRLLGICLGPAALRIARKSALKRRPTPAQKRQAEGRSEAS